MFHSERGTGNFHGDGEYSALSERTPSLNRLNIGLLKSKSQSLNNEYDCFDEQAVDSKHEWLNLAPSLGNI